MDKKFLLLSLLVIGVGLVLFILIFIITTGPADNTLSPSNSPSMQGINSVISDEDLGVDINSYDYQAHDLDSEATTIIRIPNSRGPNSIIVSTQAIDGGKLKSEFSCSNRVFPIEIVSFNDNRASLFIFEENSLAVIAQKTNMATNMKYTQDDFLEENRSPCLDLGQNYIIRLVTHTNPLREIGNIQELQVSSVVSTNDFVFSL